MRHIRPIIFLTAFTFFFNAVYSQKKDRSNFLKLATAYTEYMSTKVYMNNKNSVLIIGTTNRGSDSLMFIITLRPMTSLVSLKYSKIYKFNGYKLVVFDSSKFLENLFQTTRFENFNKGLNNGMVYENFQDWTFLMNKEYEVAQAISGIPTEKLTAILKKKKVRLTKDFMCY